MELITTAMLLGTALITPPASMQLALPLAGDLERRIATYQCEGTENPVAIEYIDASPNFLALLPFGGTQVLLAGVIADAGKRYLAGPLALQVDGTEATLADLRYPDQVPVSCTESINTP